MGKKFYELPELPYGYGDLEPYISEEQLKLHHDKHHRAYVNNVNSLLEMIDRAVKEGTDYDVKKAAKAVSFNLGGHALHSYFFPGLIPAEKASKEPVGELADAIKTNYGTFERFKKDFSQAASTVEGSGWAALTYCKDTERLGIMQIEKHSNCVFPSFPLIMVLDVWEHAYYVDYRNERGKFIDAFWNIVNWEEIDKWFRAIR